MGEGREDLTNVGFFIMDTRLKKWIKWLEIIHHEIYQLVLYKDIFWSVQDLIKKNKKIQKPSSFYRYLGDTYISYILMGIRRQIKTDKQSISFARLLSELASDPKRLSRKYYKSLYKGSAIEEFADKHFDRFCDTNPDFISSKMVDDDLNHLKTVVLKCEEFADRRIAHRDKRDPEKLPKYDEVDKCVDILDKLYVKYHLIFHAASMNSMMPTYQYDWQEIFDEPWRI